MKYTKIPNVPVELEMTISTLHDKMWILLVLTKMFKTMSFYTPLPNPINNSIIR